MGQTGAMQEACREIHERLSWAGQRKRRQQQIEQLVQLTDAIVDELERLNLNDVERVDFGWKRRLTLLFAALPFPYTPWLRAHPSPTEVLDVLFDIQARLLDLRRLSSVRADG